MGTQTLAQPQYELTDADKQRQKAIASAWLAYDGLLTPPLRLTPEGIDPNVVVNRCAPIVDRGVDFLFGKPVGITVDAAAPQEAQQWLDKIWGKNEARLPLLQDIAVNGGLSGRAFLRIVPDNKGAFRLVVIDPSTVFVQTAPQDCDTVLLYCIEYSSSETLANGKPSQVYYHEEIRRVDPDGTWEIQHWTRIGARGAWSAVGEPIFWLYPFAPIFSCKNLPRPNAYWGRPDTTPDIIKLNGAINLAQSCVNLLQLIYGQPLLYANDVGDTEIQYQPGRIITMPTSEGKITAVSISSDVGNALQAIAAMRSDMDEQSGVPAVALGRMADLPKGQVSGVTMELLFLPLGQKTEKKRCLYGDMMIDVSVALLALGKFSPDITVTLQWQSPLPNDDLASVQAAVAKEQLGVSSASLIKELGYNPDEEMDRNTQGDAKKMVNFSRGQGMPPAPPVPPQPPQPAMPMPMPKGMVMPK